MKNPSLKLMIGKSETYRHHKTDASNDDAKSKSFHLEDAQDHTKNKRRMLKAERMSKQKLQNSNYN